MKYMKRFEENTENNNELISIWNDQSLSTQEKYTKLNSKVIELAKDACIQKKRKKRKN